MRVVHLNAEWARILGVEPEEALGKRLYDLATIPEERKQGHRRALAGESIHMPSEHYYNAQAGQDFYLDLRFRPMRDPRGTITGILVAVTDVSDKIRDRSQIEDQKALLESIFDSTVASIAFYDRDLRLVSCNAVWEEWSGYPASVAIGKTPFELTGDVAEPRRPIYERVLRGERVETMGQPYTPAGQTEPRYFDTRYTPVRNATGEVIGFVSTGMDVTERHRLEAKKDEFIALASHELKTPIAAIKGFAQMGKRHGANSGDERLHRTMSIIDEQAARVTRLINEMLDVSRLQNSKLELFLEQFDLLGLLREVVSNIALTIPIA
jgi:PAS domain S-box-containing protein